MIPLVALEMLWAALPRRLLAGVAVSGILLGASCYGMHRMKAGAYEQGYGAARDSVALSELHKRQVWQDSVEHRADSVVTKAKQDAALFNARASSVINAIAARPHGIRVDTVPVVPLDPMVSVYVESDSASYPAHPRLAQLLVEQDSLINDVLVPTLQKAVAVIQQQRIAIDAEHEARVGADQLAEAWRMRALSVKPESHKAPSRARTALKWAERGALIYLGYRMGRRLGGH